MPLTVSHPAAVLGLARFGLLPSALVIGSMVPDLPFFVPFPVGGSVTHAPLGVVSVDLVAGLVSFVIWHAVLVRPFLAVAPAGLRHRLSADLPLGLRPHLATPRSAGLVVASLVVGGYTHVGWDAFTHTGRWGSRHIPWLTRTHQLLGARQWAEHRWPGYQWIDFSSPGVHWAQYASGVGGALIIAGWMLWWWRHTPPTADLPPGLPAAHRGISVSVWVTVLGATAVAVATGVLAVFGPGQSIYRGGRGGVVDAAYLAVTRGGAACIVATLLAALAWHAYPPARRP